MFHRSSRVFLACSLFCAAAVSLGCSADDPLELDSLFESPCGADELVLEYEDDQECVEVPDVCQMEDPCFDDDCLDEAYALCEGDIGDSCSSLNETVYISCG